MLFAIPDFARTLAHLAVAGSRNPAPPLPGVLQLDMPGDYVRPVRTGPGRKTLYTLHKDVGRSRYMPHQGSAERLRRWKRMELKRGDR